VTRWLRALIERSRRIDAIDARCERIQEALGRIEARQVSTSTAQPLATAEFRVFSQWGEDGILQHLLAYVPVERRIFVEFGVQDYRESNTRFLLVHNNWSGVVFDGNEANIESIRRDDLYWRHNLKAERAFVTRENINGLLRQAGLSGDIGLLSIDIDGNDYWVWESIEVVNPRMVVCEYNARWGPDRAVTIPYDPGFVRGRAHHSMIYYGASLAALCGLARRKGYAFVGCCSAGNNAFFVQKHFLAGGLRDLAPSEGFFPARFREARDEQGRLRFLDPSEEATILNGLPVVEVPC
jgi:hypothetical protein